MAAVNDQTLGTVNVDIIAVNDAAVISELEGDAIVYTAGSGAVVLDQGVIASTLDVDSLDFDGGSLTVSLTGGQPSEDVLSIRNQGTAVGQIGFDGSNVTYGGVLIGTATGGTSGADLVVTFNANATPLAVSALLNNVTYENTNGAAPATGARLAGFAIDDGDGAVSATSNVSINVIGATSAVIRDEFSSVSYSNNDGTNNWSNSWSELGESTNPFSGFVEVDSSAGRAGDWQWLHAAAVRHQRDRTRR